MKQTVTNLFSVLNGVIRLTICVLAVLTIFNLETRAQSSVCSGGTITYVVDLTGNPDSSFVTPEIFRAGQCCTPPDANCVEFIVTIDPLAEGIVLDVASGATPGGSLFYQVDCGPQTNIGNRFV